MWVSAYCNRVRTVIWGGRPPGFPLPISSPPERKQPAAFGSRVVENNMGAPVCFNHLMPWSLWELCYLALWWIGTHSISFSDPPVNSSEGLSLGPYSGKIYYNLAGPALSVCFRLVSAEKRPTLLSTGLRLGVFLFHQGGGDSPE